MTDAQTVYREGTRIRATAGQGYSDRVSDDTIREHITQAGGDAEDIAFAEAVLAIRRYERTVRPQRHDGEHEVIR